MSTNCIRCLVKERTGFDLLCDNCRIGAEEYARDKTLCEGCGVLIGPHQSHVPRRCTDCGGTWRPMGPDFKARELRARKLEDEIHARRQGDSAELARFRTQGVWGMKMNDGESIFDAATRWHWEFDKASTSQREEIERLRTKVQELEGEMDARGELEP